jgi:hypothetical protein
MGLNNKKINRCRPGLGASCALCCGSYNYRLSREELEDLLIERGEKGPEIPLRHPESFSMGRLFSEAMQCPHVGIISGEFNEIGCLIYRDTERAESVESFFRGTCSNFYCAAWDTLSDGEVLFAAGLMRDWYYYGLLINDIETLQELCADYSDPEDVPGDKLEELKIILLERLIEEDGR